MDFKEDQTTEDTKEDPITQDPKEEPIKTLNMTLYIENLKKIRESDLLN